MSYYFRRLASALLLCLAAACASPSAEPVRALTAGVLQSLINNGQCASFDSAAT